MSKYLLSFPTFLLLGSVLVCQTPAAYSAPILFGSVTQNGSFYTYSYTLDNTSGPGPIRELSILINSLGYDPSLTPVSHVEPTNWGFSVAVSGAIGNPPYNEVGMFWD